jgi:hypothetical protein
LSSMWGTLFSNIQLLPAALLMTSNTVLVLSPIVAAKPMASAAAAMLDDRNVSFCPFKKLYFGKFAKDGDMKSTRWRSAGVKILTEYLQEAGLPF